MSITKVINTNPALNWAADAGPTDADSPSDLPIAPEVLLEQSIALPAPAIEAAPEIAANANPMGNIPDLSSLLVVICACALASYAVCWAARAAFAFAKEWHWKMRVLALVVGAGAGLALGGWPWGVFAGLGSGALTTTVVGVMRSRLRALANKELESAGE